MCTKFKVYHFQTKTYDFNPIQYACTKLWTSLPDNCKTCDDMNAFKRCRDNWKCVNDKCVKSHKCLYHACIVVYILCNTLKLSGVIPF